MVYNKDWLAKLGYTNPPATFNDPAGLEDLSLWQHLVARGCTGEQTDIRGDDDFGTGRTLFVTDSIQKLRNYRRAVNEGAAFAWSIAPLPHTTTGPRMTVYGERERR